jgi:hypothetical protein
MSLQNKQTELGETRPDRMASALLIIGIIIVCQVVLYRIISYIEGIWRQPYILPLIFLGGIGIVYGSFRTVKGSSVTKQFVKATLIKMRIGAIAGSAPAFVVIIIAQVIANGGFYLVPILFIAIPGALLFGVSAGGISGLILGNIWKNNKAAFVGGASAGLITSFLYILFYFRSL